LIVAAQVNALGTAQVIDRVVQAVARGAREEKLVRFAAEQSN
jgi:hypothetical protein